MEFATNKILKKPLSNSVVKSVVLNLPHSEWKPGTVVAYLLREDQFPTYPGKEWRGKIKKVYTSLEAVEVEILNRGYEGLEEQVYFTQIIRLESEEGGT